MRFSSYDDVDLKQGTTTMTTTTTRLFTVITAALIHQHCAGLRDLTHLSQFAQFHIRLQFPESNVRLKMRKIHDLM